MTRDSDQLAPVPDEAFAYEPTQAEVEDWAAHERARREAWLKGPTEAQKAMWAERERERRLTERHSLARGQGADPTRVAQHYLREAQLAAEGAFSLVFKLSLRDVIDNLVRAGREWEDEYTSRPTQRRRVALEPDRTEAEARAAQPSTPTSTSPDKS